MNCSFIQDNKIAIVDKSLSNEEGFGVESHLESCTCCARSIAAFRATWDTLQEPSEFRPDLGFAQAVEEKYERVRWVPRFVFELLKPGIVQPIAAAAMLACGIWAGSFLAATPVGTDTQQMSVSYYNVFSEYPDGYTSDVYSELAESGQELSE